jgi:hypothetical protein
VIKWKGGEKDKTIIHTSKKDGKQYRKNKIQVLNWLKEK